MNGTEIIMFAGLAAFIIATQIGRRRLTPRRLLLPLIAVVVVGYQYLHGIPTAGGDLDFEVSLTIAGALCGVLAGGLMRVERDATTGSIMTQAGVAYASLWLIVFGGRLAFAWAATNIWSHQVMEFAIQHQITSSAAWTAAFILMALSMVLTRTLIVAARAAVLAQPLPLSIAAHR